MAPTISRLVSAALPTCCLSAVVHLSHFSSFVSKSEVLLKVELVSGRDPIRPFLNFKFFHIPYV
jgi:hypothetical protein